MFHRVGLFDEAFDACEDVEFNERVHAAGLTCYFTPAVKIVYEPRTNFRALFYQLSRYGLGRAKLAFKHPRSLTLPALVPPLWVVWVVVGGLLSLFVPYLGLAVAGERRAVRGGAARGRTGARSRAAAAAWRLRIPVVFAAIHFGFAWGFWKEVAKQLCWRVQSSRSTPEYTS